MQMSSFRPLPVAAAAISAIALALGAAMPANAGTEPVPNSMAALGDSITRAFTDCKQIVDCPNESWSTGGDPAVDSQYLRLLAINPAISGANYNFAVTGSQVATLKDEAALAVAANVDYVTILIGANDACASDVKAMTPVAAFRTSFAQALDVISLGLPNSRIFVASIPDIYRQWELASHIARARAVWKAAKVCQSMLARPLSTAPADVARRAKVLQRVEDFNTQMAQECALHAHCVFDNNAVFNRKFPLSDIGTIDYFHPSLTGQAALAKVTWNAGFGW